MTVGGLAAVPADGPTAPASAVVGGLAVLGGTAVLAVSTRGYFGTSGDVAPVSSGTTITTTLGSWESSEEVEIRLPSGVTYEHEHLERERGYGWEQVKKTPGINEPEDVGQIIEDGEHHIFGEYDLIIGDNPQRPGKVVLRIDQGLVLSASAYDTVEDPLGREIFINQDEEHAIREGRDMSYEELKEGIQNPEEIWEGSVQDLYVVQMEDGTWRIIKVETFGGLFYKVSTVLVQQTRKKVDEYLETGYQDYLRKIYG